MTQITKDECNRKSDNEQICDEYRDIIDFVQGKSIGFEDTDKALKFVQLVNKHLFQEFGVTICGMGALSSSLVTRGILPEIVYGYNEEE